MGTVRGTNTMGSPYTNTMGTVRDTNTMGTIIGTNTMGTVRVQTPRAQSVD